MTTSEPKTFSNFFSLRVRLWGLLVMGGCISSGASVLGFFGKYGWFADLFSHFRVQYALGLIFLSILLCIPKKWKASGAFLFFSITNICTILPLYLGEKAVSPGRPIHRAILVNVNTKQGDITLVKRLLLHDAPELAVIEEINSRWTRELNALHGQFPHSIIEPREDNFGIGLLSKHSLLHPLILCVGDAGVPSIDATIDFDDGPIRIIATHPLPPAGARYSHCRDNQLEGMGQYIASHHDHPTLLLGDLNTTPWSYSFQHFLQTASLQDSSQGHGILPTWPTSNPIMRIPIDHCLHSSGIAIVRKEIGFNVSSDHYPLIIDFSLVTPRISSKTTGAH